MKAILGALFKGGGTGLLLLAIVLLMIWFGGEALEVARKTRLLALVGVLGVAMLLVLAQKLLAVRSAMLIEQKLRAQAQDQIQGARPDERAAVQAVQTQLDEAIQALKTSRLGKGALYKLPWYIIIGPPGSGKSTALQESGLNFPYVSEGRKGVRGVGGTRNCDWWFTDEGILLDTAGRYTTEIDDRDEWLGFLDLLKKSRKRKPINGAIVAVSISDLLSASDEELENHAKTIRGRVDELTNRLEIVFPVYLLFTKCDLIQGFVEFFEDFTKQERSQVWGCTLPYASPSGKSYREIFDEETSRLVRSLSAQRLGALLGERPSAKKQSLYLFPVQFQAALKRLGDFTELLFRPNPFQETSIFRGFYFTSGTQEGAPIDQVIRSMSAAFGFKEDAAPPPAGPPDRKSYFLNQLFTRLIFPDQTLARTSVKVQRRLRLLHYGTLGVSGATGLLLFAALLTSFFGNRSLLKEAGAAVLPVHAPASAPADVEAALSMLDPLRRQVERLDAYDREGAPLSLRWGLYRGGEVNGPLRRVYFEALRKLLIVPCAARIRQELEALYRKEGKSGEDYEALSDLLRVYQMLGGNLPSDKHRELIEHTLLQKGRWTAGAQGKVLAIADAQLRFLLTQLDRPEDWKVPTDRILVNRINEGLAQALWLLESYRDLLDSGRSTFPKVGADTFVKGVGKDLLAFEYEFSALFTQGGWSDYVKSAVRSKSESLAARYAELKIEKSASLIEGELRTKHQDRYAEEWDKYIRGVKVLPFQNLEDAARKLRTLADADQSPLLSLFQGFWEAKRLRTGDAEIPETPDLKPLKEGLRALYEFQQSVDEFVSSTQSGQRVTGSIKDGKLQNQLLEPFKKAGRGLDAAVRTAPPALQERLRGVLYQLIDATRAALAAEAQREADEYWTRRVHRMWTEQLQGRYPFDETAADEATVQAVSALLNPKTGIFWETYADLKALNSLNLEGKPLLAFSPEFQTAVRRAEGLRGALFRGGEEKIRVPFHVTLKQREGVTHLRFSVGKKEFNHNDVPSGRGELIWEGEAGAKLSIRVGEQDRWHDREFKGEWGLLRLVSAGAPKPQGDKLYACTWEYKVDLFGKTQVFLGDAVVETGDPANLFTPGLLGKLSLPPKVGR
jgi:type VI secretion system IcmF/VasK family protein